MTDEPLGEIALTGEEIIEQATGYVLIATNDQTTCVGGFMDCSGNAALSIAEKLAETAENLLKMLEDQGATPK